VVSETCPLSDAVGRILFEDMQAPMALPPWTHSAMDGYAVRCEDVVPGGELRINEVVPAGVAPKLAVTQGTATAVMTGTMMPDGADGVLVVEETDGSLEGVVKLSGAAQAGPHIRTAGEEVSVGALIGTRGQVIRPGDVSLWAALGLAEVRVARHPKVAVLVTGDELVSPGQSLAPGQIYGSNMHTLSTWLPLSGAICVAVRRVGDTREALQAALDALEPVADLVVTTGGASMGARDLLQEVVVAGGGQVHFWKVAMKPGKPVLVGELSGGTPWIGLPGNPVSCAVGYLQFVHTWVRRSLGATGKEIETLAAHTVETLSARPDRAHLLRVQLCASEGRLTCRPSGRQGSASLPALRQADGLVTVPAGASVAPGSLVEVQLFPGPLPGTWSERSA